MNAYLDTLSGQTQPYLYLSSYGGQGYNLAELVGGHTVNCQCTGPDISRYLPTRISELLVLHFALTCGKHGHAIARCGTPNSYQIISPGGDQQYGVGGEYETATRDTATRRARAAVERDNITNFSPGTLYARYRRERREAPLGRSGVQRSQVMEVAP